MRWLLVGLAVGCGHHDCTKLEDGDWTMSGAAFGMDMTGVVTVDSEACTFTLGDWDMEMLSLPTGGSIDGDQLTLDGDPFWRSCTGTVAEDGTSVDGACQDGDDFTMDRVASR